MKPCFGRCDDVGRQVARGDALQQLLVRVAADLERRIEPRAQPEEVVIEIRHARLERVRHRRAVDLGEEIVGKPQPRVDVEQVVEIRRRVAFVVERLGAIGDARRAPR